MISRILSIIALATLVSLSSGCSGMRNFLFGRGARCGLCNSNPGGMTGPQFGNTMQSPCGSSPCGAQPYAGQPCGNPSQSCGVYGGGTATAASPYACGSCGSFSNAECGCGYADPYMSGGSMSGGSIGVPQTGATTAPIQGDDFSARRFDTDGSRILWEEPYAAGTSL